MINRCTWYVHYLIAFARYKWVAGGTYLDKDDNGVKPFEFSFNEVQVEGARKNTKPRIQYRNQTSRRRISSEALGKSRLRQMKWNDDIAQHWDHMTNAKNAIGETIRYPIWMVEEAMLFVLLQLSKAPQIIRYGPEKEEMKTEDKSSTSFASGGEKRMQNESGKGRIKSTGGIQKIEMPKPGKMSFTVSTILSSLTKFPIY